MVRVDSSHGRDDFAVKLLYRTMVEFHWSGGDGFAEQLIAQDGGFVFVASRDVQPKLDRALLIIFLLPEKRVRACAVDVPIDGLTAGRRVEVEQNKEVMFFGPGNHLVEMCETLFRINARVHSIFKKTMVERHAEQIRAKLFDVSDIFFTNVGFLIRIKKRLAGFPAQNGGKPLPGFVFHIGNAGHMIFEDQPVSKGDALQINFLALINQIETVNLYKVLFHKLLPYALRPKGSGATFCFPLKPDRSARRFGRF